jgi:hypothetical protein
MKSKIIYTTTLILTLAFGSVAKASNLTIESALLHFPNGESRPVGQVLRKYISSNGETQLLVVEHYQRFYETWQVNNPNLYLINEAGLVLKEFKGSPNTTDDNDPTKIHARWNSHVSTYAVGDLGYIDFTGDYGDSQHPSRVQSVGFNFSQDIDPIVGTPTEPLSQTAALSNDVPPQPENQCPFYELPIGDRNYGVFYTDEIVRGPLTPCHPRFYKGKFVLYNKITKQVESERLLNSAVDPIFRDYVDQSGSFSRVFRINFKVGSDERTFLVDNVVESFQGGYTIDWARATRAK